MLNDQTDNAEATAPKRAAPRESPTRNAAVHIASSLRALEALELELANYTQYPWTYPDAQSIRIARHDMLNAAEELHRVNDHLWSRCHQPPD